MADGIYAAHGGLWYLEGFVDDSRRLHRIPILKLPFSIGRRSDQDLTLNSSSVSSRHATIRRRDAGLEIEDLGSTNGTLLNSRPLNEPSSVDEGDIIQFATLEFRLGVLAPGRTEAILGATTEVSRPLPALLVERTMHFRKMLETEAVEAHFQPIVDLGDRRVIGHEVLGRSRFDSLPLGSWQLFDIAAVVGAEAQLSRLFRSCGARDCRLLPDRLQFFFNTHPAELREDGLVASLEKVREDHADLRLILEIHEAVVAEPSGMRQLQRRLRDLNIGLAYDDFGAGQARLAELAAAPPDYLKFDRKLVQDIDQAGASRQRLLEALVKMATDLDIRAIAEGIERPEEAAACAALGFQLGQGFLFGAPAPVEELVGPA